MSPKHHDVFVVENGQIIFDKSNAKVVSDAKEFTYDEALDIIGFGKVQIATILACGLILMAVLCETMGMMMIVIASQCDLNMQTYQKGLLTGVAFFGILITSYFWGFLQDRYGRRKIVLYSTLVTVLFSLLSVLTNNFWIFLMIRLCCGICISGPSAGIYAYLGEMNTTNNRQTTISWASIFVGFACTFIPGIAWIILPQTWSFLLYEGFLFRPWKLTLILYSLPGLAGAIIMTWLPESPKFLLSQNQEREAFKIVEWIYVKNTRKTAETFIVKKLKAEGSPEYPENYVPSQGCKGILQSVRKQTAPLFQCPYIKNFAICCVLQFGIFCSSSGLALWFPEIQNRYNSMKSEASMTVCQAIDMTLEQSAGISNVSTTQTCDDSISTKVFVDAIMIGIFYIIGYVVLAFIINPVGRCVILPIVLLLSGFCGTALLWATEPSAVVLFFSGFLMLSGLCVSIVNGAIVDLIPTRLRGMAVCLQLSMGRLGSIVGSNIVGWSIYRNCFLTFSSYSGFMLCKLIIFLFSNNYLQYYSKKFVDFLACYFPKPRNEETIEDVHQAVHYV